MKIEKFFNAGSVILLFFVTFLIYQNIEMSNELGHLDQRNLSLVQDSLAFEERLNEKNSRIITQRQTIVSERQAKQILAREYESLKKIKNNTTVRTVFNVDSVLIPSDPKIVFIEKDSSEFIQIPAVFEDSTDYWKADIAVSREGLHINKFEVPNRISVTVGLERNGFFRRSQPVVMVEHSNPLVRTSSMTNVQVEYKVPFYNTRTFNIGVGFAAGYLLAK